MNSGEKIFWIPSSPKLGYSTNRNFLIAYFSGKWLNSSLWVKWYGKHHWFSLPHQHRWTPYQIVICDLRPLGRIEYCNWHHTWLWKPESSRSGRGKMRSRHPKQLCFFIYLLNSTVVLTLNNTHTWFSGRTMFSPRGVSNSYTLENNQSLEANPPTSTTCWKHRRLFGNQNIERMTNNDWLRSFYVHFSFVQELHWKDNQWMVERIGQYGS